MLSSLIASIRISCHLFSLVSPVACSSCAYAFLVVICSVATMLHLNKHVIIQHSNFGLWNALRVRVARCWTHDVLGMLQCCFKLCFNSGFGTSAAALTGNKRDYAENVNLVVDLAPFSGVTPGSVSSGM